MARPIHILSTDEVQELAEAAGESISGIRNAALVEFLHATGLRISEALNVMPHDLEHTARGGWRVHVASGKGGYEGWSVIVGEAWRLRRWLRVREEAGLNGVHPVFCTISQGKVRERGAHQSPQSVDQMLKRLAARVQTTKRVHAHGFRHSHAVGLYQRGVPQAYIGEQLRHRSASSTFRYLMALGCVSGAETLEALDW